MVLKLEVVSMTDGSGEYLAWDPESGTIEDRSAMVCYKSFSCISTISQCEKARGGFLFGIVAALLQLKTYRKLPV